MNNKTSEGDIELDNRQTFKIKTFLTNIDGLNAELRKLIIVYKRECAKFHFFF